MGKILKVIFEIAGMVLGIYLIWPDIVFFLNGPAGTPAGHLPFMQALERGEHAILYLTLVLLPAMYLLSKMLGHKFYTALAVIVFSGLCVVFAQVLHASFVDGYVFLISKHKVWNSIARPAAIFIIVAGNWFITFSEMYRVAKVAGK